MYEYVNTEQINFKNSKNFITTDFKAKRHAFAFKEKSLIKLVNIKY